ncbi:MULTISPECIES: beta-ketoacyl-ACP synthase III [unclassified Micromonospora]|uniref:beta-ketoacyl-ACP synthase III n=1 Tax=unclassified Micromonospora TaxID=2617518 RepID=UPI00363E16AF
MQTNGLVEGGYTTAGRVRSAVLRGVGGQVPARTVTNDEVAARTGTSVGWIEERTGIRERRVVDAGTATSDLAVGAAEQALKSAGGPAPDVLIVATTTPDHPCPATAPAVAQRLGLGGVAAFDLNAVCTGFVYGLATAAGLVRSGMAGTVLVVGADTFSTIVDPDDRDTAVMFGDGAGAVVVGAGDEAEPGALLAVDLGSDGSLEQAIQVAAGGSRLPSAAGLPRSARTLAMSGRLVYRHAVRRMSQSCRAVLTQVGWRPADVDRLVPHQGNLRILREVAAELGVDATCLVSNISHVGNTAAASIPLALADAVAAGELRPGDRTVITAFGGGATWGSVALRWPHLDRLVS